MKRSSIVIRSAIALALVLPLAACGQQGTRGEPGPAGADGAVGAQGEIGPQGIAGPVGPVGPMGPQGATGSGSTGATGPQGPAGPAGPIGAGIAGPQGATGATGLPGAAGATGPIGPRGLAGADGATGQTGPAGPAGAAGLNGTAGAKGADGAPGAAGVDGAQGPAGPAGPAGSGIAALFYSLSPMDNASTVAPGTPVSFPQDGPSTSVTVARLSATTFVIDTAGVYRVTTQVSVAEAGQLVVALNGTELAYTVAGRATGTSQIVLDTLVTVAAGDVLSINNSMGSQTALTVLPLAGGSQPSSATLVIQLVK